MSKLLTEFLKSADPLSDEAMLVALRAREESGIIDFKVNLENVEREWLEVTKDIMAFANTEGGYLVFGVVNGTYERVGLSEAGAKLLSDTNNLMQKFNKYVEPPFTELRAKTIECEGKTFVVIHIPATASQTHMVSKDGAFDYKSGVPKTVLRQGTFYVRRSGANHLADARDLAAVIGRRIHRYRAKLLEGITRVVEAPVDREVFVVKEQAGAEGADKKFIIEDAPDAIGVKGLAFTIPPETMEQEVAAWIALNKGNPTELPSARTVWKWYAERHRLQISAEQKLQVVAFSFRRSAPVFFWLQGAAADAIREVLAEILKREMDLNTICNTLAVSAYLGKRFHKTQVAKLRGDLRRFGSVTGYPVSGPRSYYEGYLPRQWDRKQLLAELDRIAKSAQSEWDGKPSSTDGWSALRIDSFLYAQDVYAEKQPVNVDEQSPRAASPQKVPTL